MVYLPGFLGKSSDWPGGLALERICQGDGLWRWAECVPSCPLLIGYSLGGRIALHALITNPHRFKAAVILSAHPGLQTPEERLARLAADAIWAKRFLQEPWDSLMTAWNAQPLFHPPHPKRLESDYNRHHLAHLLTKGSLGGQEDLRPYLTKLTTPILWVTGSKDKQFQTLAQEMGRLNSYFQIASLPGMHHRLLQEKKVLQTVIHSFFCSIGVSSIDDTP